MDKKRKIQENEEKSNNPQVRSSKEDKSVIPYEIPPPSNPFEGSDIENEDEPEILSFQTNKELNGNFLLQILMKLQEQEILIEPEMSSINAEGKLSLAGFNLSKEAPKIIKTLKTSFDLEVTQTSSGAKWRIFIQAGSSGKEDFSSDLQEFLSQKMDVIQVIKRETDETYWIDLKTNKGITELNLKPLFTYKETPFQMIPGLSSTLDPEYTKVFLKAKSLKFVKPSSILENSLKTKTPFITIGKSISYKNKTPSNNCFAIVHKDIAQIIKENGSKIRHKKHSIQVEFDLQKKAKP